MTNKRIILLFLVGCLCLVIVQGQSTIPATGGNATGTGGSVSYTIGQVTYQTSEGTTGTVAQGVQQPYEISVVTAVENTEGITLEYNVYPNPTKGLITLSIKPVDHENLKYRLYDLNGILLQDKKVEGDQTQIQMERFRSGTYFMVVSNSNKDLKTFKIIKN